MGRSTRETMCTFVILLLLMAYTSADVAYVQISEQSITESRGCHLPRNIRLSVRLDNETLPLKLTRNDDVDSNAPLFVFREVGDEKTIVKELLIDNQREAQFQDEKWEAAMTISCFGEDQSRRLRLKGILTLRGKEYKLEPKSRDRRAANRDEEEYTFEKEPTQPIGHDYREAPLYDDTAVHKKVENDDVVRLESAIPVRPKRAVNSQYYVDVLTLIDYSIYKRYYGRTEPALSARTRKLLALQNIREYFAYIMNGVNLRYKRITGLTARLVVRLIGYVVAETSSQSPWTENFRVLTTGRGEVDADKVLKFLTKWVPAASLPNSDHVMLFTGYDMYTIGTRADGSLARSTATSGLAYISTMCRSDGRSISIVEDNGGFQCIDTAAHELGHSLGARHDGDNNSCKAEDRFIMSGGTYKKNSANLQNPWIFSSCSITYFNNFLMSLMQTRYGINCMTQKISAVNVPTVQDAPGQVYSPDEQCQSIHGSRSRLCQGPNFLNNTSLICVSMYCLDPSTTGTCFQYEAARGTTCGNKKWCINGKCVYSPDAPVADDKCPFGDQSGVAFDEKTCEEFISGSGVSYCYQKVVRGRCCKSCGLHYTGVQNCLYGDKVLGCKKQYCDYVYSNGKRYDTNCCGTCGLAIATTGRPTTPTPTPVTQRPTTAVVTQAPTPGTCSDIGGVTFSGMNCAEVVAQSPSNCYSDLVKLYCCGSCAAVSTGTPGCGYGDKVDPCMVANCGYLYSDGSFYDVDCCATCNYTATTTETTTNTAVSSTTTMLPTTPSASPSTSPTTTTTSTTTTITPRPTTTTPSTTPTTIPSTTTTTPTTTTTTTPTTTTPSTTPTTIPSTTTTTTPTTTTTTTPTTTTTTTPSTTTTTTPSTTTTTTAATTITTTSTETISTLAACIDEALFQPCMVSFCDYMFDDGTTYDIYCCATCKFKVSDTTTTTTTTTTPTTITTPTSTTTTTTTMSTTPKPPATTTSATPLPTMSTSTMSTTTVTPTTTTTTKIPTTTKITTTKTQTPITELRTVSSSTTESRTTTTPPTTTTPTTTSAVDNRQTTRTDTLCFDASSLGGVDCSQFVGREGKAVCYNTTVKDACCVTCMRVALSVQGCEYGDRNPRLCSAAVSRSNGCQGLSTVCCSSCKPTSSASGLQANHLLGFIVLFLYVFLINK